MTENKINNSELENVFGGFDVTSKEGTIAYDPYSKKCFDKESDLDFYGLVADRILEVMNLDRSWGGKKWCALQWALEQMGGAHPEAFKNHFYLDKKEILNVAEGKQENFTYSPF